MKALVKVLVKALPVFAPAVLFTLASGISSTQADPTFAGCDTEFPHDPAAVPIVPFYPSYQPAALPLAAPTVIAAGDAQIVVAGDPILFMCKQIAVIPGGANGGSVVAIAFNTNKGIPDWVSYEANLPRTVAYTGGSTQTLTRDGSQFYMDPEIKSAGGKQAVPYSYFRFNNLPGGGNYAKGHYMPSHASLWDPQAQDTSFSFANAAPQHPSMNSGVWSNIEAWVRQGAQANITLTVITGTYGRAYTNHIGFNFVSNIGPFPDYQAAIPACFYKVLYNPATNESVAFLTPNNDTTGTGAWETFVITVNDLEQRMLDSAQNAPVGQPQQDYSVRFPMPVGANKDWPTAPAHWPINGTWPADGTQSQWYTYPGGGMAPAVIGFPAAAPSPAARTATFPGC